MSAALTGEEWVARAITKAEDAVVIMRRAQATTGSTGDVLRRAYDQLHTASEHLCDAGFELGIGDVRHG